MAKPYPPEFRMKVLDVLDAGRAAAESAHDLDVSDQTIYNWRNQHLIDTGQRAGLTSSDHVELVAARKRIAELEADLAASKRAVEVLTEVVPPKQRRSATVTLVDEGHSIQSSCRALDVAESSVYAARSLKPSKRPIRDAWLRDLITAIHADSRSTYGARRVHAELTLGMGVSVGHNAVEMSMGRAGLEGLPGNKRARSTHGN